MSPDNILAVIQQAFANRAMPIAAELTSSTQLTDYEYDGIQSFKDKKWSDITCEQLEQHYDVVCWFSPEAFCYYLPGILSAGIKENKARLVIYDSIIGMLDRSPEQAYWDDFFKERWLLLNSKECEAVLNWLAWLESKEKPVYENTFLRAKETLSLVKRIVILNESTK